MLTALIGKLELTALTLTLINHLFNILLSLETDKKPIPGVLVGQ
jgi:hypothetical protein